MRVSFAVITFLAAAFNASAYEVLEPREGKCVSRSDPDVTYKLGKNSRDATSCANKCLSDAKCVAMEFEEPKFCNLYYTQVKKVGNFTHESMEYYIPNERAFFV